MATMDAKNAAEEAETNVAVAKRAAKPRFLTKL